MEQGRTLLGARLQVCNNTKKVGHKARLMQLFFCVIPLHGVRRVCAPVRQG